MASEIQYSVAVNALKNGAKVNMAASAVLDMAGDDMIQSTQLIGTSAEALTMDEVSGVPARVMLVNLDTTNFVLVGFTNPPTEMRLDANGGALSIRPALGTIYLKADTAACRIAKAIVEA